MDPTDPKWAVPQPTARCRYRSGTKPDVLAELLRVLRRMLDYFLCCVTCGCYRGPRRGHLHGDLYDNYLTQEEHVAVQNLLDYLDSAESKEPTLNDERLRALCILAYSDNVELQRSAALCFAELSDRMTAPVSEIVLEPLVILLGSRDQLVQKTASLAISNFALNGPDSNKLAVLCSGALPPLIRLLYSDSVDVQCNTCGSLTTLATDDKNKCGIVAAGGVSPLLTLARSRDLRVQRNATGALLNLTHLQSNREELVRKGALPVLVHVLGSPDVDVQYYVAAALSNMAVSSRHRAMLVAIGHYDVLRELVTLLSAPEQKVQCQACLALRNLASDSDNQLLIVKVGCLPPLHYILQHHQGELLCAALACLRNLSIHRANEKHVIKETFLGELKQILRSGKNPLAQVHAAGTIRNLAAGDHVQEIANGGCQEALVFVLMTPSTEVSVLLEVTAALAVLTDEEKPRRKLFDADISAIFRRLVVLACECDDTEVCYNCAGIIGQLALSDPPASLVAENKGGLLRYLCEFLESRESSLVHLALWTIINLEELHDDIRQSPLVALVSELQHSRHRDAIKELANAVLDKMAADDPVT